jgi:hypothetical protein
MIHQKPNMLKTKLQTPLATNALADKQITATDPMKSILTLLQSSVLQPALVLELTLVLTLVQTLKMEVAAILETKLIQALIPIFPIMVLT